MGGWCSICCMVGIALLLPLSVAWVCGAVWVCCPLPFFALPLAGCLEELSIFLIECSQTQGKIGMDANFRSMRHGCRLRPTRTSCTTPAIQLEKYNSSSSPQTICRPVPEPVSRACSLQLLPPGHQPPIYLFIPILRTFIHKKRIQVLQRSLQYLFFLFRKLLHYRINHFLMEQSMTFMRTLPFIR